MNTATSVTHSQQTGDRSIVHGFKPKSFHRRKKLAYFHPPSTFMEVLLVYYVSKTRKRHTKDSNSRLVRTRAHGTNPYQSLSLSIPVRTHMPSQSSLPPPPKQQDLVVAGGSSPPFISRTRKRRKKRFFFLLLFPSFGSQEGRGCFGGTNVCAKVKPPPPHDIKDSYFLLLCGVCSIFGPLCCTELLFFWGGVATASDRDSPATEGKF